MTHLATQARHSHPTWPVPQLGRSAANLGSPLPGDSLPAGRRHLAPPLVLPITGDALRQALARGDARLLNSLAAQLRVAGCHIRPEELARQLLATGCADTQDPHAQAVTLRVQTAQPA